MSEKRECFCRLFLRDGLHVHDCPDAPKPEPRWCNRVEHGSDCPDWCAGKPTSKMPSEVWDKKPKPPKLQRRHSWAAASNGVIACKVCGTPIRDSWMTECLGEPEPPPDVAKKHHWTTPDANPDGPIICRYCEVMMTRENESEECKGKPPDVAREQPLVEGLFEDCKPECYVRSNPESRTIYHDARCRHFQDVASEPDTITVEAWMYRDLVKDRDEARSENAALKAKLKAADHLIVTLTDNSAGFEAERDEARAEADTLRKQVTALTVRVEHLAPASVEKGWRIDAEKALAEARIEAERRLRLIQQYEEELSKAKAEAQKLREERDAAEAILLTLCSKGGPRTAGIWDDADAVVAAIKRRREEKGIHDPISKGRGER